MAVSCPASLTPAMCCGTPTHNATDSWGTCVTEHDCTQRVIALNTPSEGKEAADHLALLPGANSIPKTCS